MSVSTFEEAFAFTVGAEGGYSDRPGDPGGRTMYGITERDHPDLWSPGPPTLEQAQERYRRDYWDPIDGDALPAPVAMALFDCAVNVGPAEAVRILQEMLGFEGGEVDGSLGAKTTRALVDRAFVEVAADFNAMRSAWYRGLARGNGELGRANLRGWLARADRLTRTLRAGR